MWGAEKTRNLLKVTDLLLKLYCKLLQVKISVGAFKVRKHVEKQFILAINLWG